MLPAAVLQDFESLPPNAQAQVIDFIAFVKGRCMSVESTNHTPSSLHSTFGSVSVKKRVTLEQMEAAIKQQGGTL